MILSFFPKFSLKLYLCQHEWVDSRDHFVLHNTQWYPNSRKIFYGKLATNVQITYMSTQHNIEMAFFSLIFFSLHYTTDNWLSHSQNGKMAKQILKTFSVIKNSCLDVEREFFKDNVAFHFSLQRFKRKRNVLKSSNYNSIWSITLFQNLFKDSRFYWQLFITTISRKIIVFSVFIWMCVLKKSIWFIIAKDLSRNVKHLNTSEIGFTPGRLNISFEDHVILTDW